MSIKLLGDIPRRQLVWYLASPYSTPVVEGISTRDICKLRHERAELFGLYLIKAGYICWEPIASSFFKAITWGVPQTYEFWQDRDRAMIEHSDGVIDCDMVGWKQSTGVTDEIKWAKANDKSVYLCTMNTTDKSLTFSLIYRGIDE